MGSNSATRQTRYLFNIQRGKFDYFHFRFLKFRSYVSGGGPETGPCPKYSAILELVTAAKNINVGSVQLFLRYFQYPERSVHNMDKKIYHRKL